MTTRRKHQPDEQSTPPARERADGGASRRESVVDRRVTPDRRLLSVDGASDFDRRRGAGRRLSDFTRGAEEGELSEEQFLFLMAIEEFKRANGKTFPSWTDVLEVVRLLGYRKTMPSEVSLHNAADWREPPNSPSNVRPERWSERLGESRAA